MPQNTDVVLPEIHYTRADYTALRAHYLKIPIARITQLYYSEDSVQVAQGLERFLIAMRIDLIERAIGHNPALSNTLKGARRGGDITTKALEILIKAADAPAAQPEPHQAISMWFRPRTAASLNQENIQTLAHLVRLIRRRGSGWWRSVPRIGALRAGVIVAWLAQHQTALGMISHAPVNDDLVHSAPLMLNPDRPDRFAPLGRFTASKELDGSHGINRGQQFCFIQAKNDLQAIEFYLTRFEDQPHTWRAYRKELERFLLWSILIAGKPLSSLLVDDAECYKRFLLAPTPEFVGIRAPRFSERWKPFSEQCMTPKSQRHAVIIIRAAFSYLTGVRYLAGNPWLAVKDPSVTQQVNSIQIEKALTENLWYLLIEKLSLRCKKSEHQQDRIALATILLLGDSGLRREEAACAKRKSLNPSPWGGTAQVLQVLGKRNKLRDVPVSSRTLQALRAHWFDRGLNFDDTSIECTLLGPLIVPQHSAAIQRHQDNITGYTADGLYRMVQSALNRLQQDDDATGDFSQQEINQLSVTTPHAFRHTFGTLAVANGMPLDVAQIILGHTSGATTAIYVQAKKKRMMEEAMNYFEKKS